MGWFCYAHNKPPSQKRYETLREQHPTTPPSHHPTIPPSHHPTIPPSHHPTIPPIHQSTTGDLDIIEDLTILGAGQDETIIDGQEDDRVLHAIEELFGPEPNVTLSALTIQNGEVEDDGGGIFVNGSLTLTNVIVTDNLADGLAKDGGGIHLRAGSLTNSPVSTEAKGRASIL